MGTVALRLPVLELGRRLVRHGGIDQIGDVFLLPTEAITNGLSDADQRELVTTRQAEMTRWATVIPPPTLGEPPPEDEDDPFLAAMIKLDAPPAPREQTATVIRGTPASPGTLHGRAKVARSLEEASTGQPGQVLVCEMTLPTWSVLFSTLGAVVADTGGVLSHCATVTRGYGIPCVVGTIVGTTAIQDGAMLAVDGTKGEVRILDVLVLKNARSSHCRAAMEMLWLGEPSCGDAGQVGGKAASLSRLATRYRIPPGFCIPVRVCSRWARSAVGRPHNAPNELVDGLAVAYRALAERCGRADPPVAVRSSASDEDGALASFAGQYETVLNVTGVDAIIEAVIRCWASATSARLAGYRRRQGLPDDAVLVPVLVQQLVVADVAAVAFSANPVTRDRGEIIINASWGLGESLVGGSVTPDTYVVRRAHGTVVQRLIACKKRMTVPVEGGTREVDVPRALQDAATLDDAQIMEVAQLAIALEAVTGTPVDVECAYQHRELYLLQCRPITTFR